MLLAQNDQQVSPLQAIVPTGNIIVAMTGFRNDKNLSQIALYNSAETFLQEPYTYATGNIKNKLSSTIFANVPWGDYAIAIYHDENANGKMDRNFFGIPEEGYGFSNNAKGFFGPPGYDQAKFEFNKNTITVNIVVQ